MSKLKNVLPLEEGAVEVTDESVVTEQDVVAALAEAEQTLSTENAVFDDDAVFDDEISEEINSEEQRLADAIAAKRNDHVQQFKLEFELDDIPDAEGMGREDDTETEPLASGANESGRSEEDLSEGDENGEDEASVEPASGCLPKLIFAVIILIVSCVLAAVISTFLLDVTGSTRNSSTVDVLIPEGANTEKVAGILEENGLIDNVTYFRIYSRLTGADGKWQPGAFILQADMGFPTLIETLQVSPPRETVTVMLREGLTVDEMAEILEKNGVCSMQDFLDAVQYGDFDYDFIHQIPTEEDNDEVVYRVYRLEGYLFPDTYEFYVGSKGETVVDKMLGNFQSKLTEDLLAQIEEQGWTLDEAITFASMVQGEGDTRENMDKVSRVLHNRLDPDSGFKTLELCSTRDYANEMAENDHFSSDVLHQAYNTYKREGFPIGPIGNPGMDALLAALNPSEDATIKKCYFFATDYKTMTTYFSKTFKEHQAIIKKYGIEDLG